VGRRGCSASASAASDDDASGREERAGPAGVRGFARETSAARVFHSPQPAHCPCHFGEDTPQFWQIKTSFDFAMAFLRIDL
jgi:hypothetical protein